MTEEELEFLSILVNKQVDESLSAAVIQIQTAMMNPQISMVEIINKLDFRFNLDSSGNGMIFTVADLSSGYSRRFTIPMIMRRGAPPPSTSDIPF
jgi:hypothetical protein